MSRAYRIRQPIRVHDKLSRNLAVSDEICTELELLEVLPADQMGELLQEALRQRDFVEEDGAMVRRQKGGITIRIDPQTAEVKIRVEAAEEIEVGGSKESSAYRDTAEVEKERIRAALADAIRRELEQRADEKEGKLQEKVSAELEASLGDLGAEFDQVANEVTREALKRKAASLGQIKAMSEDPQTGSLTITVEV